MPYTKAIRSVVLAALVTMAGCTHTVGHDFTRPEQVGVVLGQTTEADILSRYGAPASRTSNTRSTVPAPVTQPGSFDAAPVPGVFTFLHYRYVLNQAPIAGGDLNQKGAVFTFWNGVLVAHDFTSSFATDSSDFDEIAAQTLLAPRKVTREEVIARLGNPGGRFIYPTTPAPGMERLHYSYQKFDMNSHQRRTKAMDIVFNAAGQMVDYRAASAANPFAPAVSSASSGGIVFVPTVHSGGGRR